MDAALEYLSLAQFAEDLAPDRRKDQTSSAHLGDLMDEKRFSISGSYYHDLLSAGPLPYVKWEFDVQMAHAMEQFLEQRQELVEEIGPSVM